jgi:hypothetical protein
LNLHDLNEPAAQQFRDKHVVISIPRCQKACLRIYESDLFNDCIMDLTHCDDRLCLARWNNGTTLAHLNFRNLRRKGQQKRLETRT